MGSEEKSKSDELSKKSGKDVKEFENASKDAKDADIKNWASKTLPTLQEHPRMAKDTQKKVK